jgi:beta-phosphoglucomutase-like phosphatase (HAD superfamily)/choline kinase
MNIILPLGGKGERFYKEKYEQPKPLINIFNKQMIFYVLDNLNINNDDNVFIIYNTNLDNHHFSSIIQKKYPNIILIPLTHQTSGAVETISCGLNKIKEISSNKICVLLDCDTFYTEDILQYVREHNNQNIVFYTKKKNEKPIYSYIDLAFDNKILAIKEKEKISCNANTGCYVFNDIDILMTNCKYILDNKITFNGEPYTSCVIGHMINIHDFYGYELNEKYVFSVGTPQELTQYINNTFVFLFDLDGTLVNTDEIYFDVWKDILINYKIYLTMELFKKYIHGNSDDKVINTLIPNEDLKTISLLKDTLFIKSINKIKIIDGSIDFIKYIKSIGHQCSIVTNCNRNVAEKIINYLNISQYIEYLTIGNECTKPKPYPNPYNETIIKYNVSKNKVIIFEDSKSGLLSGRLSNVHCMVGITSNYLKDELYAIGANIVINNYNNLDINILFNYSNLSMENLKKFICNSLNFKILNIEINKDKLKGGYISDVLSLIITTDTTILKCVLKLENNSETNLSLMAKKLGLYERENYFYNSISKYVNISVPNFYGLIKDDKLNNIGILMENLNLTDRYKLNLNLNNENINISLKVITKLAKMHSKYWNKDIKKAFPELKKHNDKLFNPVWSEFIERNWTTFVDSWKNILTPKQLQLAENIKNNFNNIQENLSNNNLTLIHGDAKSPNIFYDSTKKFKPVFLDWQYVAIGKGVQDIVFFLIESFELENIKLNYPIFKNYYYQKLLQYGITNYSYKEYEIDFKDAVCHFPFFVAIWFGTTPEDDLIDKNFPFFFIKKIFFFLELLL